MTASNGLGEQRVDANTHAQVSFFLCGKKCFITLLTNLDKSWSEKSSGIIRLLATAPIAKSHAQHSQDILKAVRNLIGLLNRRDKTKMHRKDFQLSSR